MALIDEFLYALGFQADLRGGQAFDEQLKRIGDHGESTRHSLLSTITAANLLSHALEKGAEMAKEVGGEFIRTAKEIEDTKITFESMYTTAAEGEEKFRWLWTFAKANPVMGLDAAKETFIALKNNGIEPTTTALKAMGDAMAALPEAGKMLPQGLGELIEGRYASGGVLSPLVNLHGAGKNRVYEGAYTNRANQKIEVRLDFNDAAKATNQFMAILRDRFDGTMEAHSKTMTGLIARWENDWQTFQMQVMDNHVFAALEDELFSLITQWEAWAKSPDAHQMLSGISNILTLIVKIVAEAIRLTGLVAEKFSQWFGTTNSIAILLGTMFIASKWVSVIGLVTKLGGAFRDVYAALQLVAEGEAVTAALGLLMDGVLSPLNLVVIAIVAAGAGIAYMVKQWHDFKNGLVGDGALHTFLQGFEHMLVRIRASIDYMFDALRIKVLESQQYLSRFGIMDKLTDNEQKDLDRLHGQHTLGLGEYVEQQVRIADTPQNWIEDVHRRGVEMHKQHPDWSKEKIWGVIQGVNLQTQANTLSSDISAITSKNFAPPVPVAKKLEAPSQFIQKYAENEITLMGPVTIKADSPETLAQQLADANKGLVHTQSNLGSGGKKY